MQKDFCNSIGQKETHAPQQIRRLEQERPPGGGPVRSCLKARVTRLQAIAFPFLRKPRNPDKLAAVWCVSRSRHCVWLVIEQRRRQRYASRIIAGEAAYGAEQRF